MLTNQLDKEYNLDDLEEFLHEKSKLNSPFKNYLQKKPVTLNQNKKTLFPKAYQISEPLGRITYSITQDCDISKMMRNFEECITENSKVKMEQVYDLEEMKDLVEQVKCFYCQKIADFPRCCEACNQIYCLECSIKQFLIKKNKGCLKCKSHKNKDLLNCPIQKQMIFDLLTIKCSNKGCSIKYQYTQKQIHMTKCKFRIIQCSNRHISEESQNLCGMQVQYCDFENHIRQHHIKHTLQ